MAKTGTYFYQRLDITAMFKEIWVSDVNVMEVLHSTISGSVR